jgi:hypothetical protein
MLLRQNDTQTLKQQNLICEHKIKIFVMPMTYYVLKWRVGGRGGEIIPELN